MPGRHNQNPRLAKSYRCYSVMDAVELYGVHPNTIRNWVAAGLRQIDDRHEMLFNGRYLNAFHAHRRRAAKRPCGPHEIYCIRCRAPFTPVGGLIDIISSTDFTSTIEVICAHDHLVRQQISNARLAALRAAIEAGPSPLNEIPEPTPNYDSAAEEDAMTLNAENERTKHRYFDYLKEAKQLDVKTIDAVAKSLDRFEEFTGRKSFKDFRPEQASAFKRFLSHSTNRRTGEKLSKGTIYPIVVALKTFFFWLAGQPGYKSSLRYDWSAYFNLSLKDVEIAKARREPRVPTLEQITRTIMSMPKSTPLERRNRALVTFAIVTGVRDDALASMQLGNVDFVGRKIYQDARTVRTKFSKTAATTFYRVGDDLEAIVGEWITELLALGFGPKDALFPITQTGFAGPGIPLAPTLGRSCWSDAQPIRDIFKAAFEAAGLPYFNPHSFRKTLMRLGMVRCKGDPRALKAWSQNLGHNEVLTSFTSYGDVPAHEQHDLIRGSDRALDEDDERALELGRAALKAARSGGK